jgi:AraC-like DNA-binding protein
MKSIKTACRTLKDPANYFTGRGESNLPVPFNLLLFVRKTRTMLQQNDLQNRSHHRFVLAFNLQTAGYVHLDHLSLLFNPGQALLIHPYQFHHFSQLASNDLLWLICTFEMPPGNFLDALRNTTVNLSSKTLDALAVLLKEWTLKSSELQDELRQSALIRLLACLKQDQKLSDAQSLPEADDYLIHTVNRMMSLPQKKPCTVFRLAQAMNMSESRLRTLFRQTAGVPLGSYIQNYRLTRAMALLRNTTLSIADVAEQSGFGSLPAFSRTFKVATGQAPWNYRQKTNL